ncbi:hypothetical protein PMAYCL1PPCAC_05796, partial [Pristionchus mayeri]
MNSTELSAGFQSAVTLARYIYGELNFGSDACVCLLIVLYGDPRGKAYRKYIFSLQVSVQISGSTSMRESPVFLNLGRCSYEWLRTHYPIQLSVNVRRIIVSKVVQCRRRYCEWLALKNMLKLVCLQMIYASCFFVVMLFMILQLIREIKHGMTQASSSTKRYQKRAVHSLIMQGTVPSVTFIFPAVSMLFLFLYSMIAGPKEAANNQIASKMSVLSINGMSLHAFAHSLTIISCSPSYQKTIFNLMRR